jgi:hypothetical protein
MGAVITYWIREYTDEEVKISIAAASGSDEDDAGNGVVVRTLTGTNRPGFNRVVWDLQAEPELRLGNPDGLPEFLSAGSYTVTVTYGDHRQSTTVEVMPAPGPTAR